MKRGLDKNRQKIAIKVIPKTFKSSQEVERETRIHRSLGHPNILRLVDFYEDSLNFYIVLDLVQYELMDFIEIGVGMSPDVAHMHFRQLISAVKYLHGKGVCHRDIKADNILVNQDGNLLLADFGFATLCVYKGRRRVLRSIAGSYAYMAPEVLLGRYDGESADLWSCGLVLLVMHAGSLDWEEPSLEDPRFEAYASLRYHNYAPFNRVPFPVLGLVKRLLCVDASRRAGIPEVEKNGWFGQESALEGPDGLCTDPGRVLSQASAHGPEVVFSQPDAVKCHPGTDFVLSQPTVVDNLPSLKRIYVFRDERTVLDKIRALLGENIVQYIHEGPVVAFSTSDRRRSPLSGEISVKSFTEAWGVCCVTFKKQRGCALEFKKLVTILADGIKAAFPD